jgi:hypothetical protein
VAHCDTKQSPPVSSHAAISAARKHRKYARVTEVRTGIGIGGNPFRMHWAGTSSGHSSAWGTVSIVAAFAFIFVFSSFL